MSILAIGTVAFDVIETPFKSAEQVLGGSATYITLAARYFTDPVRLAAEKDQLFGGWPLLAHSFRPHLLNAMVTTFAAAVWCLSGVLKSPVGCDQPAVELIGAVPRRAGLHQLGVAPRRSAAEGAHPRIFEPR